MEYLHFGAIDVGSNAARMQISRVLVEEGKVKYKKVEYVRYPLRLGKDVFTIGEIGPEKKDKLLKLMTIFKLLLDIHEVHDYLCCATSAMRNAGNGEDLRRYIEEEIGLNMQIISGEKEAEMINGIVFEDIPSGLYLHIDVGGGSTELTVYHDGEKIEAASFPLGSLRRRSDGEDLEVFAKMQQWVRTTLGKKKGLTCIGTGGNISKVYNIINERKKAKDKKRIINFSQIVQVYEELVETDFNERMLVYSLNPDRSDVIVPATEIYMKVMQMAQSKKMLVPDLGLKDGIIRLLYEKHKGKLAGINTL